jgi:hypothetical protein
MLQLLQQVLCPCPRRQSCTKPQELSIHNVRYMTAIEEAEGSLFYGLDKQAYVHERYECTRVKRYTQDESCAFVVYHSR